MADRGRTTGEYALAVKNTFLSYVFVSTQRRSASAPPKLDTPVATSTKKRRICVSQHKARRRRHKKDDALLRDAMSRARAEQWAVFARLLVDSSHKRRAVAIAVALHARRNQQKHRVTMLRTQFLQLAYLTCTGPREVLLLRSMGVLRNQGDHVEIWVADAARQEPLMEKLLEGAHFFAGMEQTGAFGVELQNRVYRRPYDGTIEPESIKKRLCALRGIRHQDMRLMHNGVEVLGDTLASSGVEPGSYLVLRHR